MRHKTTIKLRFRDFDALGHVNNAVYASYLEQARIAFFDEVMVNCTHWMKVGLILARVEIDYKAPIRPEDVVFIETRISRVGTKSFEFSYRMLRNDNLLMAEAKTAIVCFDYESHRSKAIPADWRARLDGIVEVD